MNDIELAKMLFGDSNTTVSSESSLVPGRTRTYTAIALADSENGYVLVQVNGEMVTGSGQSSMRLPTQAIVKAGDVVNITVVNGSPVVTGAAGWGDMVGNTIVAQNAQIQNLQASKASIDVLDAQVARIDDLTADFADIETLVAGKASIATLDAEVARIEDLVAEKADISVLESDYAHISNGVIDNATIGVADVNDLSANYAQIDLANVNNAWIEAGVIKDAAISSAQIIGVSANKITAGTINGSVINVTNLNADNITTGTINGQRIGSGSLSLDKLSENVYTESEVDNIVDGLNDRIDGAIETWTTDTVPTASNYPASSWTTDSVRSQHVGDICYVLNAGNDYDGFTYRYAYNNNTRSYGWVLIKDNQVTSALSRIGDLETFESNTSRWINDTEDGIEEIQTNYTTLSGRVDKTIVETIQLWYSKANTTAPGKPTSQITSTSTSGGAWRTVVPAYSASYPNYFYCYQWKYADGTYGWSGVTRDIAMGETQATSRTASSNASTALTNAATAQTTADNAASAASTAQSTADGAASAASAAQTTANSATSAASAAQTTANGAASAASAAQSTANKNVKESIQLWYTKSNTSAPNAPTSEVTSTSTSGGAWRKVVPAYDSSYPNYFYCWQYKLADGTFSWSDVVYDKATTDSEQVSHAALPASTFTTFTSSTFKTVSDKVDSQSTQITNLTEITTANGLTSQTNLSNTVNTMSQTVNTNSSIISNLTTALGTNADGTTTEGDITYRATLLEQDLSGFQSTVMETYATVDSLNGYVKSSELSQEVEGITLKLSGYDQSIETLQNDISSAATQSDLDALAADALSKKEAWVSWIRMGQLDGSPALTMGESASTFSSKLTNSELAFMDGDTRLASFGGVDGLNAPKVTIEDELHIGGWVWEPITADMIALKWVG